MVSTVKIIGVIVVLGIVGAVIYGIYKALNPPIDGVWSEWDKGSCSVSCGGGMAISTRTCTPPKNGGTDCPGKARKEEECNTQNCPVNGGWSDWKKSGNCSKPCDGGKQDYIRSCDNPAPQYGGSNCSGSNKKQESCNTGKCVTFHRTTDGGTCWYHDGKKLDWFGGYRCGKHYKGQKYVFNPNNGTVSNFLKPEYCLNKSNKMVGCNPSDKGQQWYIDGSRIKNKDKNYSIPIKVY